MEGDARANEEVRAEAERLRKQVAELERELDQHKRTEEALRESEERFRTLVDLLPLSVWETNVEGNFTYANSTAFAWSGYAPSDMDQPVNVAQTVVPEDVPRMRENIAKLFRGEDVGNPEYRLLRKDGTTFPELTSASVIVRDGQAVGMRGFSVDITERRKMEEALLVKEHAVEKSLAAIAITDIEGIVTYVNEACLGLWQIAEKKDVVGQSFWTLLELDAEAANVIALSMIERGQWKGELKFARKNGEKVDVQVLTAMVYDTQGTAIQTITYFVDVTGRLRMEQQLQRAGRLAAVGQLAAGVAHELNNPLAAIQGYAQLLVARDDFDETARMDVKAIYEQAQRAGRITESMISLASAHTLEKSLGSINSVLEDTLETQARRLEANNIAVQKDLDPRLPKTVADFSQIEQVFVNIVVNAERAMLEANGKGNLLVKTEAAGDMIRITFEDDGPGIEAEKLAGIFDPFYTTKEVGQGTGLGLGMSYRIVENHGGQIRAESELGKGARFIVELPIVVEERLPEEQVESA